MTWCCARSRRTARSQKGARMTGMRLRKVAVDDRQRMRIDDLDDLDEAAVIVATVGTTASTAVDDVDEIGRRCEQTGTWMHVDAAYAGSAMVCPEFRWAFTGIERADSLVVNAHKWMLTPQDCSLLWSRRPGRPARGVQPDPGVPAHAGRRGRAVDQRVRAGAGAPVPGAEAVGGAPLLRPQRPTAAHPPRRRARRRRSSGGSSEEAGWEVAATRDFSVVCFRHDGSDARKEALMHGSTRPARSSSRTPCSTAGWCCGWRSATRRPPRPTSRGLGPAARASATAEATRARRSSGRAACGR